MVVYPDTSRTQIKLTTQYLINYTLRVINLGEGLRTNRLHHNNQKKDGTTSRLYLFLGVTALPSLLPKKIKPV